MKKMRKISEQELKSIELGILNCIKNYCEINNINYFLGYGTLIGVIRHQGYIPWDDDIDVCMTRENYTRFINDFNKGNKRYKIMCMEYTKGYYLPFAKVIDTHTVLKETLVRSIPEMGVYVDIFPIDGLGNNIDLAKKKVKKCRKIFRNMQYGASLYCKPISLRNILKNIVFYLERKLLNFNYKRLLKMTSKSTINNSNYSGVLFGFYGDKEIMPSSIVSNYRKGLFENDIYLIPNDYNTYLANIYGDYMKLPPKEKQITHHSFIAYCK